MPDDSPQALQRENEALRRQLADAQAALAASRNRTPFLGALGHELRDPLAPIRNSVALLKGAGSSDPIIQRAQEVIDRQVTRLTRVVDELLDVSRIAEGQISLSKAELDLAGVVASAVADHLPLLEASGVGLEFEAPAGSMHAFGDAARITQIIGHLLSNASKFTDRGGQVAVELRPEGETVAVITVRDSGIGMDSGTLDHLFDPLGRNPAAPGHAHGGLGLGLALARGLAELHGGTVTARSEGRGRGSEFSLRLPMLKAGPPVSPEAPAARRPRSPRPRRILIVEDLLDAAITMELLLEMMGHTVEIAADGKAGLEKANRFEPEIVLCDIGLPGQLDGYEVARSIRGSSRAKSAYLVALTGFGTAEDKDRAVLAGFDMHLTKPIDPALLEPLIAAMPALAGG